MIYVNYLIRKNLDDLNLYANELCEVLLKIHEGLFNIEKFEEYRVRALVSLIIMNPEKCSEFILKNFSNI